MIVSVIDEIFLGESGLYLITVWGPSAKNEANLTPALIERKSVIIYLSSK